MKDAPCDASVARAFGVALAAFRRARRNTREHWRGVDALIAYMPLKTAPLSQNANAPEQEALFAKEPGEWVVVALTLDNA